MTGWMRTNSCRYRCAGMIIFLGISVLSALASDVTAPSVLRLKIGNVDTASLDNLLLASTLETTPDERLILQFDDPMTPARRAALIATGLTPGEYLPDNAMIVEAAGINFAD